jgi:hypothetical protein
MSMNLNLNGGPLSSPQPGGHPPQFLRSRETTGGVEGDWNNNRYECPSGYDAVNAPLPVHGGKAQFQYSGVELDAFIGTWAWGPWASLCSPSLLVVRLSKGVFPEGARIHVLRVHEDWDAGKVQTGVIRNMESAVVAIKYPGLDRIIADPLACYVLGYEVLNDSQLVFPDLRESNAAHDVVSMNLLEEGHAPISVRYVPSALGDSLTPRDLLVGFSTTYRAIGLPQGKPSDSADHAQYRLWPHGEVGSLLYHDVSLHKAMAYAPETLLVGLDRACCALLLAADWALTRPDPGPAIAQEMLERAARALDLVLGNLTAVLEEHLPSEPMRKNKDALTSLGAAVEQHFLRFHKRGITLGAFLAFHSGGLGKWWFPQPELGPWIEARCPGLITNLDLTESNHEASGAAFVVRIREIETAARKVAETLPASRRATIVDPQAHLWCSIPPI